MKAHRRSGRTADDGFMLVGLIVAIFLILLTLSVAAPRVAYNLRRDREMEAVRRANQYVRAIQLYYKKFGRYPGSIEQLEKSNNIRFLRQNYVDPMTGKQDYRVIPVGQNKTAVKGFFGQPLAGLQGGGLGSATGMASAGFGTIGATGATGPANVSANGAVGAPGASGAAGAAAPGAASASGAAGGFGATGSSGPFSGGSSSGGSPFMGVGLGAGGTSILEINGQQSYDTWEFLYDPRLELLKQKAGLNGANAGSVGASTLGQTPGTPGASGATGGTLPAAPPSSPFTVQPPQ